MNTSIPSGPAGLQAVLASLQVPRAGAPSSPERVLERALDLPSCVALDRAMATLAAPAPPADAAASAAQLAALTLLEDTLTSRLASIGQQLDGRFARAFSGPRAAPNASSVLFGAREDRVFADGSAPHRSQYAQRLARRYVSVVAGALQMVLKELGWLRAEVHGVLQDAGSELQALCELDQALDALFRAEVESCRGDLAGSIAQGLCGRIASALADIPQQKAEQALARWFEPGGMVACFMDDGRALVRGLMQAEWAALMGLVQGALELQRAAIDNEVSAVKDTRDA